MAGQCGAVGRTPHQAQPAGRFPEHEHAAAHHEHSEAGGEVPEKAKDSTRATSVRRTAAAESSRSTRRRVAAAGQNPPWLAPTAVVLLIVGLAYLVTYYISSGQLPLPNQDWNPAVGLGVLMGGRGMLLVWK